MTIETTQVGSFEVNCSVLAVDGKAWIIDPGADPERILSIVRAAGCVLGGVLLTHAHFDHIGAIPALERASPGLPVFVHERDAPVMTHAFNQFPPEYPAIPRPASLVTGEWPGFIEAIETPGHTPGGVCFKVRADDGTNVLFSGDTLFAGSVGRTDFPGGSRRVLMESLRKLVALPDETLVIPGHGPRTTIGREKKSNPYLA